MILKLTGQYRMGRVKTESKRNEILEAASRVFGARQFHEVLIDDVAAEAGVGKGTIYRYFETKEDLYFGTILHGFDSVYASLATTLSREASPAQRLERIAHDILSFLWTRGYFSVLLQKDERRFEKRDEELQKRRELLNDLLQQCLIDGIERGDFRGIDVRVGAELFRGMIRAAAGFRREDDTVDDMVAAIVEIFMRGIVRA